MGGTEQLARAAGALAGLGLAIAAAAPFTGVPPRGVSGALAPAQIEVRVLGAGEFDIQPTGTVLKATPFPQPGERGGPTMTVSVRNITGVPLRLSARLVPIAPSLDAVATIRGSVAGAVILRGPLSATDEWTQPAGLLPSGATSTLRIRFKLRKGLDPDAFAGRLDIRQLELKGTRPGRKLEVPSDVQKVVPGTKGAEPVRTPPGTTPTSPATPLPSGRAVPAAPGASTPQPAPPVAPRGDDAPRRRAPDEGAE